MRYILSFVCPPLAVLLCGNLFLAILLIPLSIFYLPAVLIALLVVASHKSEVKRSHSLERALDDFAFRVALVTTPGISKAEYRKARLSYEQERRQATLSGKAELGAVWVFAFILVMIWGIVKNIPHLIILSIRILAHLPAFSRAVYKLLSELLITCKESTKIGYRSLPEWAQPITWGLAAGTPFSIALIVFMVTRR